MDIDIENEYPPRSKSPMYDELSLPFIDASLPPTPKVGRIVNGLDILLGRGVSENSLVGMYLWKENKNITYNVKIFINISDFVQANALKYSINFKSIFLFRHMP